MATTSVQGAVQHVADLQTKVACSGRNPEEQRRLAKQRDDAANKVAQMHAEGDALLREEIESECVKYRVKAIVGI